MEFRLWLENEEDDEYLVRSRDMDIVKGKLEKLNRRAAKLNMPPVTMDVLGKKVVKETSKDGRRYEVEMTRIRLAGAAPKLKGWTFVARIVHGEHGNMVMGVPDEEVPPRYRTSPPTCDHCRSSRNRKDTFVVKSDSGEFKQVGTNCLRDFLGTEDPAQYVLYFSELKRFMDDMEDGGFGGGRGSNEIETLNFVATALAVIRKLGFVSKRVADEKGGQTTSASLFDYFFGMSKESASFRAEVDSARRADDVEKAEKMIAWARSIKDAGEENVEETYLWNLSVAAEGLTVDTRSSGLMASLPSAYQRAMAALEPKPDRAGAATTTLKPGDKYEGVLTVEKVRSWSSQYGVTTLHIMKDDSGQTFKWKASRESLDEGSRVKIKGSVKTVGPDKYEGGAVVVELTRCKVVGVVMSDGDRDVMSKKADLEAEWKRHFGHLQPFLDRRPLSDGEVERYCLEYAMPSLLRASPEWELILKRTSQAVGVPYDKLAGDFYKNLESSSFGSAVVNLIILAKEHTDIVRELTGIMNRVEREGKMPMASSFVDRMKEVAGSLWKAHAAESRYKDREIHKEWWLR